jgi:hypothetical protein
VEIAAYHGRWRQLHDREEPERRRDLPEGEDRQGQAGAHDDATHVEGATLGQEPPPVGDRNGT